MKNRIPNSILNRSKQAYRAPILSVFQAENRPEYVDKMLSEQFINQVGIFDASSLKNVLAKIQKSGISSEIDNMLITFVVSTHLLFDQFINKKNIPFKTNDLKNTLLINDF